jgi:Protein of unknown function (DUF559)
VISLAQLRETGLSYGEVRGLIDRGHLIPLHRGVYIVGHTALLRRAYLFAGLLAIGEGAFLSHRSAAAARAMLPTAAGRVEVTVVAKRVKRRSGLIVHRTDAPPHPDDVRDRGGLRVSSVPRMLVELAPRETEAELRRLITASIRRNALDLEKMEQALARSGRRPGLAKLKRALRGYRPTTPSDSGLEDDFTEWLGGDPGIPEPLRGHRLDGRWQLDFYWPEQRLAIELDGRPYHIAVEDFERDRAKDTYLQLRGIRVMRVTGLRFEHDRPGVRRDIHAFLDVRASA